MFRTELVTADGLRSGDLVVPSSGDPFALVAVDHEREPGRVWLQSSLFWFDVPCSCRFVRVCRDRRIDTRPDLRGPR